MLFIVKQDGLCMIVDSHKHLNDGTFIAYCPSTSTELLAEWFAAMLQETWQCNLRYCSIIPFSYFTL